MNEEKASQEKELSIEVEFNDIFDITVAEDFRLKLVDALNNAQAIKLLASKIERADTAALQMLCAFFKDANTKGISVNWCAPSNSLRSAVALLGLSQVLTLNTEVVL